MANSNYKFFAPGRVNLIGEHIDYNGGLVLPAAIHLGITLTLTPTADNEIHLSSDTHSYTHRIHCTDEIVYDKNNEWCNYPLGIIQQLKKEGFEVPGCKLHYSSNLPEGSGLSSSAAIELVTAYALLKQVNANINLVWLANFCKQVENEFIGVQCGIMDQYAIALGKHEHALLINCATLQHDYVPIQTGNYTLLLMNTNKPRSLVHSKYNERKQECEEALRVIRHIKPEVKHLCDIEPHHIQVISDEVVYKRARHVVTENLRVKESAKALQLGDLSTLGRLMNASHASLEHDYEVTGVELDTLVHTAQEIKGCLGARMTGAGFGGCAIAVVHQSAKQQFIDTVGEKYSSITRLKASFTEIKICSGVCQVTDV